MNPSLSLYLGLARRTGRRGGVGTATGPRAQAEGPLLWLHVSQPDRLPPLVDLVHRLREEREDLGFLLTGASAQDMAGYGFPAVVKTAPLPSDHPHEAQEFLAQWCPDLLVWAGGALRPALLHSARERALAMIMIDAAAARFEDIRFGRLPGLARPLLRGFDAILARDSDAAQTLVRQGARKATVQIGGTFEQGGLPLPCDEAAHAAILARLAVRPVWLALAVQPLEEAPIITAHRAASSLSHRLLLVLEPADPGAGAALAQTLCADGWRVALRSDGGMPDAETQICINDIPDERGLWLRIAPVSFIGGTLTGGTQPSPFQAAALGSAILHGPMSGPYQAAYQRFDRAGAAQLVQDGADLGRALETVLAPDKAAAPAGAAWEISSAGAEAMDGLTALLLDRLDLIEAR